MSGTSAEGAHAPFVFRMRPRWAHSDPARMIYTARFADFCLDAIDAWFEDRVGADWYHLNVDWGIGTPFVHIEIDFRSAVTPRDTLLIGVRVTKVGATSLTFAVAAHAEADGRLCFEGRFVNVCVPAHDQGRDHERGERLASQPMDPRIRAAAEADMTIARG